MKIHVAGPASPAAALRERWEKRLKGFEQQQADAEPHSKAFAVAHAAAMWTRQCLIDFDASKVEGREQALMGERDRLRAQR